MGTHVGTLQLPCHAMEEAKVTKKGRIEADAIFSGAEHLIEKFGRFKYIYTTGKSIKVDHNEVERWISQNTKGCYLTSRLDGFSAIWKREQAAMIYMFDDPDDGFMFKMRWC